MLRQKCVAPFSDLLAKHCIFKNSMVVVCIKPKDFNNYLSKLNNHSFIAAVVLVTYNKINNV